MSQQKALEPVSPDCLFAAAVVYANEKTKAFSSKVRFKHFL